MGRKNIVKLERLEVDLSILRESIKTLSREFAQEFATDQAEEAKREYLAEEAKRENADSPLSDASKIIENNEEDGLNFIGVKPQEKSHSQDIIERFLQREDLRIVAPSDDEEMIEVLNVEGEKVETEDLLSEQLAEIYLSQALYDEAIDIYRKLSLLKSEKSVYFAEKIVKIKTTRAKGVLSAESKDFEKEDLERSLLSNKAARKLSSKNKKGDKVGQKNRKK